MPRAHFIADDFGRDPAVNRAIVRAHREGVLTGASLMAGQPGFGEAVELARANPGLEIGWHVQVCDSRPLTMAAWPWGDSPAGAGFRIGTQAGFRSRLRDELDAQWAAIRQSGLPCAFVNCHHHLHLHPLVLTEIRRTVGPGFPGWLRGFRFGCFPGTDFTGRITQWGGRLMAGRLAHIWRGRTSGAVWGVDRFGRMEAAEITRVIAAQPEELHEFIFHPRSEQGDADLGALIALRRSIPEWTPGPVPGEADRR